MKAHEIEEFLAKRDEPLQAITITARREPMAETRERQAAARGADTARPAAPAPVVRPRQPTPAPRPAAPTAPTPHPTELIIPRGESAVPPQEMVMAQGNGGLLGNIWGDIREAGAGVVQQAGDAVVDAIEGVEIDFRGPSTTIPGGAYDDPDAGKPKPGDGAWYEDPWMVAGALGAAFVAVVAVVGGTVAVVRMS